MAENRYLLSILFVFFFGTPNFVSAQNSDLDGHVTPVYGTELPPFQFIEEGRLIGFWVDLVDQMSEFSKINFQINLIGNHVGARKIDASGETAVIGLVLRSASDRDVYQNFKFSDSFGKFNLRLYSQNVRLLEPQSLNELPQNLIVVGKEAAFADFWLTQNSDREFNFLRVTSFDEATEMLLADKSLAFFGAEWAMRHSISKNPKAITKIVESAPLYSTDLAFAVHNTNPDLLKTINEFAKFSNIGTIVRPGELYYSGSLQNYLYRKWLPQTPLTPEVSYVNQLQKSYYISVLTLLFVLGLLIFFAVLAYVLKSRKDQLFYTSKINHDLRDELVSLQAALAQPSSESRQNELTSFITAKMLNIIDHSAIDRLSFSGFRGKNNSYNYTTVSQILATVTATIDVYQVLSSQVFNFSFHPSTNDFTDEVELVESDLSVVLSNLIKNAAQHSGADSIDVDLFLRPSEGERHSRILEISVSHPLKHEPHDLMVFLNGRFFGWPIIRRANPIKHGGGLWLIKQACKNNKWSLRVSSLKEIFKISILIKLHPIVKNPTGPCEIGSSGVGVLIVDDSTFSSFYINQLSEEFNQPAFCFESVEELKSTDQWDISLKDYACIFIDNRLPGIQGHEFISEIIHKGLVNQEKICLLTGDINDASVRRIKSKFEKVSVRVKPLSKLDFKLLMGI